MAAPDLDAWIRDPTVRVAHRVATTAAPERIWEVARGVRLQDTRLLGRLVRWRIPSVSGGATFEELFSGRAGSPFMALEQGEFHLLSGIVGRIWTIRRDYPTLGGPDEFREWDRSGTVRAMFANWVEPDGTAGSLLRSETRVEAFGVQGRLGLSSVRPLIRAFQQLIATDALATAVRASER